jgi:membrane fusion protein, multidrug efflux system
MRPGERRYFLPVCLAVAASALLGGCRRGGPAGPPRGKAEVATVTVEPRRVVLTTELPGRTAAYLVAEVRPQVSGLIQKRAFEEGSDVGADQLLYQIDPAPYQAALDQAEASLAMAEANLPAARARAERLKGLAQIRAVGQQDYEDATAALQRAAAAVAAAKAAVQGARINLGFTPIKAPIAGRIGRSSVTPGALVTAFQPLALATIQQMDPIYVDVTQASAEVLRIRRNLASGQIKGGTGQSKVTLLLEDGTPYSHEGALKFRDVTVDPTTGSVHLRMVFPNPEAVLLPGMFVRAVVEEGVKEQGLLAPQQGVTRDPKGNAQTLIVDGEGKVAQRQIEVDRTIGDAWLVTRGLEPGDRVIVDGLQRIRVGDPVNAVPYAAPAAPGAAVPAQPVSDKK